MKRSLRHLLLQPPILNRNDIFLTLLPALLWISLFSLRPTILNLHCIHTPQSCQAQSIFAPDRLALGMENKTADSLSFVTQNGSGYLAIGVPLLWGATRVFLKHITPMTALITTGVDLTIILQSVLWNGMITESVKLLSQRPRPFVYEDPAGHGQSAANYTSFYSGHTSFSASAGTAFILTLLGRGAPKPLLLLSAAAAGGLIVATASFRVMAGRHFITDVIAGTLAGILISILVAYFHRKRLAGPSC